MTVSFLLNGSQVSADIPANKRLVDILREEYGLLNSRAGCYAGVCGSCAVLLDENLVQSCLVPALSVQGSDVITFEGLSRNREFAQVLEGLHLAGAYPCRNCLQSKTLTIYALLAAKPMPDRGDVLEALAWHRCTCTDLDSLCDAVNTIVSIRRSYRHALR